MKGYTIDFTQREIIKTGVLSIETKPKDAQLFVNSEPMGESNKIISNADIGEYLVRVEKDGYFDYRRDVPVYHAAATLIEAQLIYQEPKVADSWNINSDNFNLHNTPLHNKLIQTELEINEERSTKTLTINLYEFSRQLFNAPEINNEKIAEIDISETEVTQIEDIILHTNSEVTYLLITIDNETALIPAKKSDQDLDFVTMNKLPVAQYLTNKQNNVYWGLNNDILVVDTPNNIISFNVRTNVKTILYDKPRSDEKKLSVQTAITKDKVIFISNRKLKKVPVSGGVTELEIHLSFLAEEEQISNLWVHPEEDIFVIATDKNSYLLGDLYPRSNGLAIRPENKELTTDLPINKIELIGKEDEYSYLKLTNQGVRKVHIDKKDPFISYVTETEGSASLSLFIYNKPEADMITKLGPQVIYTSPHENPIFYDWVMNNYYFLIQEGSDLVLVDYYGENAYTVLSDVGEHVLWFKDPKYLLYQNAPLSAETDTDNQANKQPVTFSFIEMYK